MALVALAPIGNGFQFFLPNGLPNNGGYLNTYTAGTTSPLATYNSSSGSVANATSIQLQVDGRLNVELWLVQGQAYKFVVADSTNTPIPNATYDNLTGINDIRGYGLFPVSGNLGIGVTPAGWGGGYVALQLGTSAAYMSDGSSNTMANNCYYDGTNWRYLTNNYATRQQQTSTGQFQYFTAPSGVAGNVITWTQQFGITNAGAATFAGSVAMAGASFTGAVTSTKSVALSYIRTSPNYAQNTNMSYTPLTFSAGGTATSIGPPSANATFVDVQLHCITSSNNATASRYATIQAYTDNAHTLFQGSCSCFDYEFSALGANTVMGEGDSIVRILLSAPGASFYLVGTNDAGAQSGGGYYTIGYGD